MSFSSSGNIEVVGFVYISMKEGLAFLGPLTSPHSFGSTQRGGKTPQNKEQTGHLQEPDKKKAGGHKDNLLWSAQRGQFKYTGKQDR